MSRIGRDDSFGTEELCTRIQKVVTVDVKVMTMKMDRIEENAKPNAETIKEGGIGNTPLVL